MQTHPTTAEIILHTRNMACAILDIYARLRGTDNMQNKMKLLHEAREKADLLATNLQQIAQSTAHADLDLASAHTLEELGPLMEQILVQEREYRTSVGGGVDSDTNPQGNLAT